MKGERKELKRLRVSAHLSFYGLYLGFIYSAFRRRKKELKGSEFSAHLSSSGLYLFGLSSSITVNERSRLGVKVSFV